MKKLFSVITVFLFAMGLTACDTTELDDQIADLQEQVTSLQQSVAEREQQILDTEELLLDLQEDYDTLADLPTEVSELQADLLEQQSLNAELTAQLMDVEVTVSYTDLFGHEMSAHYGFDTENVPSLAALITLAFGADIIPSEYGSFLHGFDGVVVPYGSYISISENDTPSMVGLDDLVIDDDDHFHFDVVFWDTTQQAVFEAIHLFIDNQIENYISTDFIDYNVLLACQDLCDYTVTEAEMKAYLDGLTLSTTQDYFKAIMIANTFNDMSYADGYITDLHSIVTTGAYGQTGIGLLALDSYPHDTDYSTYITTALHYYTTTSSPYDEGLDAGAYGIMALANYTDETGVQALIDEYIEWVIDDQLPSGGIKTRDIVWNDTTYPGTENAATLSQVILALIANDLDPASGDFIEGDTNLILRLTEFQLDDGTFDWDLTDEIDGDPAFSTPQAFVALVTYYHYMNTYGEYTSPYIR